MCTLVRRKQATRAQPKEKKEKNVNADSPLFLQRRDISGDVSSFAYAFEELFGIWTPTGTRDTNRNINRNNESASSWTVMAFAMW